MHTYVLDVLDVLGVRACVHAYVLDVLDVHACWMCVLDAVDVLDV